MSLRTKIALVLFCTVTFAAFADHALNRVVTAGRCDQLDIGDARIEVDAIRTVVEAELAILDRAAELAIDTVHENIESLSAESGFAALARAPFDVVLAYDHDGRVLFHKTCAPFTGEAIEIGSLPNEGLPQRSVLLESPLPPPGIVGTERGPMLLAVREVGGISKARVAIGKMLDTKSLPRLVRGGETTSSIVWLTNRSTSETEDAIRHQIDANEGFAFEELGPATLRAWGELPGLRQGEALLLQVDAARKHRALGTAVVSYDLLSTAAIVVLVPLAVLILLQWIVTGPLRYLTSHALDIGHTNDTSARLGLNRTDEIGQLASEFDRMLGQLEDSRADVVRTARMAGMSDLANGVMHNVGNVLNGIAISTHLTRTVLREATATDDLSAILSALEKNRGNLDTYLSNDVRGQHLLSFLSGIVERLRVQTDKAVDDMTEAGHGIEQIRVLLNTLQNSSSRMGLLEDVELPSQLNSVVELCLRSMGSGAVEIMRDYEEVPRIALDRHRLTEVLANIVRNALQAMIGELDAPPCLRLRISREGNSHVTITVEDNGTGIEAESLPRVFAAHYSTKPDANGLGLHLAATTAVEMGGSLSGHSDGPGEGARFTLRLPTGDLAPRSVAVNEPIVIDSKDPALTAPGNSSMTPAGPLEAGPEA